MSAPEPAGPQPDAPAAAGPVPARRVASRALRADAGTAAAMALPQAFARFLPGPAVVQAKLGGNISGPAASGPGGQGHALPAALRDRMEGAAGADFSDVRVHVSGHAAVLGARAFATGSRLYFAPGQYQPSTESGRRLIGHELSHVLQQRTGAARASGAGPSVLRSPALEAAADRDGALWASAGPAAPNLTPAPDRAPIPAPSAPGAAGPVVQGDGIEDVLGALVLSMLGGYFLGPRGATIGFMLGLLISQLRQARQDVERTPTLADLPRGDWWRMFIDPQHRAAASRTDEPSLFYDRDQSPGFRQSMTTAYERQLLPNWRGALPAPTRTYAQYNELHNQVTAHLPLNHVSNAFAHVRRPSGKDIFPPTSFPIGGHDTPAADIWGETLAGQNLLVPVRHDRNLDLQTGICFYTADDHRIQVNYTTAQGQHFAQAALDRYHLEIAGAHTANAKLSAIARCIRALHVIHAFRDANGRLHMMLMLPKMLQEQGFPPVILQDNPEVFGGSYSIAELVQVIIRGMQAFRRRAH